MSWSGDVWVSLGVGVVLALIIYYRTQGTRTEIADMCRKITDLRERLARVEGNLECGSGKIADLGERLAKIEGSLECGKSEKEDGCHSDSGASSKPGEESCGQSNSP